MSRSNEVEPVPPASQTVFKVWPVFASTSLAVPQAPAPGTVTVACTVVPYVTFDVDRLNSVVVAVGTPPSSRTTTTPAGSNRYNRSADGETNIGFTSGLHEGRNPSGTT